MHAHIRHKCTKHQFIHLLTATCNEWHIENSKKSYRLLTIRVLRQRTRRFVGVLRSNGGSAYTSVRSTTENRPVVRHVVATAHDDAILVCADATVSELTATLIFARRSSVAGSDVIVVQFPVPATGNRFVIGHVATAADDDAILICAHAAVSELTATLVLARRSFVAGSDVTVAQLPVDDVTVFQLLVYKIMVAQLSVDNVTVAQLPVSVPRRHTVSGDRIETLQPTVGRGSPTTENDAIVVQLPVDEVTWLGGGESSGGVGCGCGALGSFLRLSDGTLEALLSAQIAAVLEHVAGVRVQRPVTALTYSNEYINTDHTRSVSELKRDR